MKKVIDFCKKEYKIMIPVMVVIVLLITVYFLYREYKYDNYRNKQEYSVYQYFADIKKDYTAIVTYNLKDVIIDLKPKDIKIDYDSTPMYFKDADKVLFPKEMSIVFPLRGGIQYKLLKYSTYEKIKNLDVITSGDVNKDFLHFYLYDGKDLFFFPSEMELKVNGKKLVTLSPMSYARVVGGYTLVYYDRENDIAKAIELDNDTVTLANDMVSIDIINKYSVIMGKKVILSDIEKLKPVSKTDWQVKCVNDIIKWE